MNAGKRLLSLMFRVVPSQHTPKTLRSQISIIHQRGWMWLFPGWSALMCTWLCVELTHCGGHTIRSEGLWSLNTPHKWCTAHSSPLELWPPRETDREREHADEEIISVFIAIRLMREGWSTWQLIRLILFSKHSRVCVVVSVYDIETELVCETRVCESVYACLCACVFWWAVPVQQCVTASNRTFTREVCNACWDTWPGVRSSSAVIDRWPHKPVGCKEAEGQTLSMHVSHEWGCGLKCLNRACAKRPQCSNATKPLCVYLYSYLCEDQFEF